MPHGHWDGTVYMYCIWKVSYTGIVGYGRRVTAYYMTILYRDMWVEYVYVCVYVCMYVYVCMNICTRIYVSNYYECT